MMAETDGVLDKMKSLFSAAFEHELHMTITKNVLFTVVWIKIGRAQRGNWNGKIAIWVFFVTMNLDFWDFRNDKNVPIFEFKVFTILQMVDLESLHSSKLISRKMRVEEKSSDFHTVFRGNAIQNASLNPYLEVG